MQRERKRRNLEIHINKQKRHVPENKFFPRCEPCLWVSLNPEEMARLADLSASSGMRESEYVEMVLTHALECGCTFLN